MRARRPRLRAVGNTEQMILVDLALQDAVNEYLNSGGTIERLRELMKLNPPAELSPEERKRWIRDTVSRLSQEDITLMFDYWLNVNWDRAKP
jgi:hypothetical protein